jgi:hypothetical protein
MNLRERIIITLQVLLWWAHRLGGQAVPVLQRWGWAVLLCWPAAAHAMPALLAAAATAAISSGAIVIGGTALTMATTVFASLTVGNLLFISTAIYGAVEQRRASKKARAAANAAATDRMAPTMSAAEAPWQVIYGEATVGPCQVAAQLTSGDRDQFKYVVYIWAAHECQQFMETYINGVAVGALDASGIPTTAGKWLKPNANSRSDQVTLNGSAAGFATFAIGSIVSLSWSTGTGDSMVSEDLPGTFITLNGGGLFTVQAPYNATWAGRTVMVNYMTDGNDNTTLRIQHHLGTTTQTANSMLLSECPSEWTANDRLRGLCYSVVRFSLDEPEFQSGPPQVTVRLRGKRVYDPRTTLTAWSDNVALCVADFLTSEYGKAATTGQVQWTTVTAAANACDETLASQGGARRFTSNGAFRTDGDPDRTLDELCQAMAGFATWNGTWALQAGVYTAPVATVDDSWNAGSVEVMADQEGAAVFNGLKGRFYDPSRFDQRTDYAPYQNAAFKAADNGLDLWDDLDLPFTNTQWRAQNLARIQVERSRGMQLVVPCNLRALSLRAGQRVTYANSVLGITGSVFRVVKRDFQLGQPVMLTLQQDAADNYDEADAVSPPASPSNLNPDPFVVTAPSGVAVTSGDSVTQLGADGSIISRVRLTLTASEDALVTNGGALQIETRLPVATGAPPAATDWTRHPEAQGSSTSVQLLGLRDRQAYLVRVRYRNGLGAVSAWVERSVVVQGTLSPTRNAFAATRVWNFTAGTAEGWAASGATLGTAAGFVTLTSSGTDPQISISGLAINGRLSPLVRVRLRRTAGSGWQGDLYYSTAGHASSESFKKRMFAVPPIGQWVVLEWDMAALTAGGSDWLDNTINALRFDLGASAADVFEIDWIALGYVGPATEGANWGLNIFGQPQDNQLLNSYQLIGMNRLSESDQPVKERFLLSPTGNGANIEFNAVRYPEAWGWTTANFVLQGGRTRNTAVRQDGRHTGVIFPDADSAGNTAAVDLPFDSWFPVIPGERVCGSAYVLSQRCTTLLYMAVYDAAGNLLDVPPFGQSAAEVNQARTTSSTAQANVLGNYQRPFFFAVIPANAARARLIIRKYNTQVGQADSWVFKCAPQLAGASANAQGPAPYQPGPVAAIGTDQILDNSATDLPLANSTADFAVTSLMGFTGSPSRRRQQVVSTITYVATKTTSIFVEFTGGVEVVMPATQDSGAAWTATSPSIEFGLEGTSTGGDNFYDGWLLQFGGRQQPSTTQGHLINISRRFPVVAGRTYTFTFGCAKADNSVTVTFKTRDLSGQAIKL